ncbi:NAD(P)-binding domain-containing protein [Actinomycetaceae bacterium L2_0104]
MRIQEPARGSQRRSFSRIPTGAWIPAVNTAGNAPAWHSEHGPQEPVSSSPRDVDVLIIGAGQAGLAMAHELKRRGFVGYVEDGLDLSSSASAPSDDKVPHTFLVLDAENRPGGAWQHRWPSLTMATVNHIADLPGFPAGHIDPSAESADWVPSYFADFEDEFDLPILRPVLVTSVTNDEASATPDPNTRLLAETTAGTFRARMIVNCTGTWTRPFIPYYPGAASFRGMQCHTQDYPGIRAFEGRRVVVVGGGVSALSHLDDLGGTAKKLLWVTRTPPRWHDSFTGSTGSDSTPNSATIAADGRSLTAEFGREVEERVRERVEAGLKPLAVVAVTGLPINDFTRSLHERGLLKRKPMFDAIEADGVRWADGKFWQADAIIWATGFRAELRHLMPLGLRVHGGGIVMDGTRVAADPRIHLLGYGPSASTIGARWASRLAAKEIIDHFRS